MNRRPPSHQPAQPPRGFSLVEVLIALAVITVGVLGSMKALEQVGRDTEAARDRGLAGLSAENGLAEVLLNPNLLQFNTANAPCPQAGLELVCERRVDPTEHPQIRRVAVRVRNTRGQMLAERVAFLPQRF